MAGIADFGFRISDSAFRNLHSAMDKVYLTSNKITPDGAQLHDDRTSFDSAGAGECELCNNFSASSCFFLVFEPAPGGVAIYWIPPIPRTIPSILLSCRRIPFPQHYTLPYLRRRVLSSCATIKRLCAFGIIPKEIGLSSV